MAYLVLHFSEAEESLEIGTALYSSIYADKLQNHRYEENQKKTRKDEDEHYYWSKMGVGCNKKKSSPISFLFFFLIYSSV